MVRKAATLREVKAIAAKLRLVSPLPHPVSVRRCLNPKGENAGTIEVDSKCGFLIRLRWDLTYVEAVDTMIHEWAHAHDWDRLSSDDHPHNAVWGVHYAEVYRAYFGVT